MSNVTLTKHYGPREIAPKSLWTGLTRYNTAIGSWQHIQKRALGEKALSGSGIWLPISASSEQDFDAVADKIRAAKSAGDLLIEPGQYELAMAIIEGTEVSDGGCWLGATEPDSLRLMTEIDTEHKILEDDGAIDLVRQCDTPSCIYHRHYDFTFNVPSGRRELVYPNHKFYRAVDDGILTAWADILPDVQKSRAALEVFREQSMPFVDPNDSLLSVDGISQICLVPTTGCWFVRKYYMTPTGKKSPKGWQYDGYGRLRVPSPKAKEHNYIKYSTLAHRIVWMVSGRPLPDPKEYVLNHKCGFRPCANPEHLEKMTPQQNNIHGLMMELASAMISDPTKITDGISQLIKASRVIGYDPSLVEAFWGVQLS
ncbi:HNH endonuclease [Candidatus Nomurabacteria bacterium]|nr:HNH endonuclease [Candidatus Nomurabacteria bacterium]